MVTTLGGYNTNQETNQDSLKNLTVTTLTNKSYLDVSVIDRPMTQKMDNNSSGQPTYIGEAAPGTATSATSWRIRKMEYDDGVNMPPTGITWAEGDAEFDKEWDERTNYNYS